MIRSQHDLERSLDALGDLYAAMAALRQEHAESSMPTFGLLAEGPLHSIAQIQQDVDVYTGASAAARQQAPLWIRLVGPRARWGETPSSVVTACLDTLRKGVQSLASSLAAGRNLGRPPAELQLACDFEVALFAEGSFEVGVRLPDPEQGDFFPVQVQEAARTALQEFLAAAAWAARPLPLVRDLEDILPEAKARRVALRAIKQFVPRKDGGISFVELYGTDVQGDQRIHLTPDANAVIAQALAEAVDEREEAIEGEIREMDLDKRTFRLRNVQEQGDVPCKFGEELLPTAAELLGKRVVAIGLRRSAVSGPKGPLVVTDIQKQEARRRPSDA